MANLRTIQFLRNAVLYNSLEEAKTALTAQAATAKDGSPIAGRYTVQTGNTTGDTEVRTVLGIVYNGTVSFFNNDKEIDNILDGLDFGPIGYGTADVVNGVGQADGTISAATVHVGSLLLTDYTKGSDSGSVAATDSINAAMSKLENQIDAANNVINALDASTVSGDSKVVIDVTQEDGQITATAANLTGVKLDGLTTGTDAKIAATDTLGVALANIQAQIDAMDKAADVVAGQVVTTVTEQDGKVTETKANVKDLQLGGYVKDTTATGDIASTDTINAALSKLENKAAAITINDEDRSINVTPTTSGTDISVNIKSGEHVLAKDGNAGLYTDLDFVKITTGLPETVKERYQLLATDDSQIGVDLDIPKDSHIVSINYITTGEHAQNLEYVYLDVSGNTQTTYVDMSELVLETEFGSGVTVTDHVAHGVVDPASESFLTVGAGGFRVSGVQDAIDDAIEALDVSDDTAVAGQYVAAIEEADGIVAVKTRANVSEAVLNNYTKGSDASAVTATDTVNQAISKLENQVDAAKAAATTEVVEGTDAGNNMTIVKSTDANDGHTVYTVNLTDVASASALTDEIAARKAVDGQNGDTYAANTSANYINNATSLNDADVKLDTAVAALSAKTFTEAGSANNSITFTESTAADGTTHIDAQTDASKISGLTAVANVAGEISGVSESDSVQTGIENLYASLAAEIAARKAAISATSVHGSNAIQVTEDATSGDTISLILDDSTQGTGSEKTGTDNALTITDDGLFLSTNWDCGTFNEQA